MTLEAGGLNSNGNPLDQGNGTQYQRSGSHKVGIHAGHIEGSNTLVLRGVLVGPLILHVR
jgi:hypothetical protein